MVVDNLRLLVLGPILVGLVALGIGFLITPVYTATTRFLVPQGQSASAAMMQSLGALAGLGAAAGLKALVTNLILYQERFGRNALIDRFSLMDRYDKKFRVDTRKALAQVATITSNAKDGIVTVEANDKDPKFAADLANGHMRQELQRLLGRLAITEAQQRRLFFEKLLATTNAKWVRAAQELKATGVNSSSLKLNPASALEGVAIRN